MRRENDQLRRVASAGRQRMSTGDSRPPPLQKSHYGGFPQQAPMPSFQANAWRGSVPPSVMTSPGFVDPIGGHPAYAPMQWAVAHPPPAAAAAAAAPTRPSADTATAWSRMTRPEAHSPTAAGGWMQPMGPYGHFPMQNPQRDAMSLAGSNAWPSPQGQGGSPMSAANISFEERSIAEDLAFSLRERQQRPHPYAAMQHFAQHQQSSAMHGPSRGSAAWNQPPGCSESGRGSFRSKETPWVPAEVQGDAFQTSPTHASGVIPRMDVPLNSRQPASSSSGSDGAAKRSSAKAASYPLMQLLRSLPGVKPDDKQRQFLKTFFDVTNRMIPVVNEDSFYRSLEDQEYVDSAAVSGEDDDVGADTTTDPFFADTVIRRYAEQYGFRACYYAALCLGAKLQGDLEATRQYFETARVCIGPCFSHPSEQLISALLVLTMVFRSLAIDYKQAASYSALALRMTDLVDVSPQLRMVAVILHNLHLPGHVPPFPEMQAPADLPPHLRYADVWGFITAQLMHDFPSIETVEDWDNLLQLGEEGVALHENHGLLRHFPSRMLFEGVRAILFDKEANKSGDRQEDGSSEAERWKSRAVDAARKCIRLGDASKGHAVIHLCAVLVHFAKSVVESSVGSVDAESDPDVAHARQFLQASEPMFHRDNKMPRTLLEWQQQNLRILQEGRRVLMDAGETEGGGEEADGEEGGLQEGEGGGAGDEMASSRSVGQGSGSQSQGKGKKQTRFHFAETVWRAEAQRARKALEGVPSAVIAGEQVTEPSSDVERPWHAKASIDGNPQWRGMLSFSGGDTAAAELASLAGSEAPSFLLARHLGQLENRKDGDEEGGPSLSQGFVGKQLEEPSPGRSELMRFGDGDSLWSQSGHPRAPLLAHSSHATAEPQERGWSWNFLKRPRESSGGGSAGPLDPDERLPKRARPIPASWIPGDATSLPSVPSLSQSQLQRMQETANTTSPAGAARGPH